MTDKVQPALTPDQWAMREVVLNDALEHGTPCEPAELHRIAALCLYGQPYGLTHEDVAAVEWAVKEELRHLQITEGTKHGHLILLQLESLAHRIAALLPPEIPEVNVVQISGDTSAGIESLLPPEPTP